MNKCLECGAETHNNKFCSRRCAGLYNGKKLKFRTDDERKQKNKEAVVSYRRRTKLRAVEYKGGCCERCGYDKCIEALEFHHTDPNGKDFGIASGGCKRWERIVPELDKCIMLCANCHREEHASNK
ncbi:HNH endonuclease [Vibrio phage PVA8]|nr:HNH endonuclease [Vibrio phage PC-Liy1]URQ03126.1 HNH endonuclease [Vibrio phage PVA8]WBM58861.1 hypothetical protein vBValMPVA8_139 [Vibrio phage vB_ValM_PVA8]WOL24844.1 hypothetical protein [Vibrio phage PG216]